MSFSVDHVRDTLKTYAYEVSAKSAGIHTSLNKKQG